MRVADPENVTLRCVSLLTVSLLLLLPSCARQRPSRIIVLGLDGLDPRAVDLLVSEDKLPHFAQLRRSGAYGRLSSSKPLLSPVLWTTIATGKPPHEHGIGHFTAIDAETGETLPVTSGMRRVKALWNIFSEQKRKVGIVGWWASWPAEPVNGSMVTDHLCYHFLFPEGQQGPIDGTDLTHPSELADRLRPLLRRPADVTPAEAEPFVRVTADELGRPFDFDDELGHFKWALATAETHRAVGLELWRREQPDLLMVYVEGTDSVSHLFGHLFRRSELGGELLAQQKKYGRTVEQMYIYADRLVGEYLAAMDESTTLVVLSDHGFELGAIQDDPSQSRDMRRVSERFHSEEGILYLFGNQVTPGSRLDEPALVDVAPTLLALAGLLPAQDMPGRVLTEGLELTVPGPLPETYETEPRGGRAARDEKADPQLLDRLQSLGYLDGKAGGKERRVRSPTGERNIAALHFEAGRLAEAERLYRRLVEEDPGDDVLHTSLAGVLGALGRHEEADQHLEAALEINPLNVEAYHNRAVIREREGRRDAAIELYRTAVRYSPRYEPSRRALVRLVGSTEVHAPRTDSERRAFHVARVASAAARRGNYSEAMRQLDEAARLAPRSALVQQYRSNVAYLMGDLAAATEALRKGLEIEPDNALFQANLRRLEAEADSRR